MEPSNTEAVRRQQRALAVELQRWESDPAARLPHLRAAIRETQQQLQTWDEGEVYPDHHIRFLRDAVAVAEARITQAAQEKARGY